MTLGTRPLSSLPLSTIYRPRSSAPPVDPSFDPIPVDATFPLPAMVQATIGTYDVPATFPSAPALAATFEILALGATLPAPKSIAAVFVEEEEDP